MEKVNGVRREERGENVSGRAEKVQVRSSLERAKAQAGGIQVHDRTLTLLCMYAWEKVPPATQSHTIWQACGCDRPSTARCGWLGPPPP
jgi:hypothetical protein